MPMNSSPSLTSMTSPSSSSRLLRMISPLIRSGAQLDWVSASITPITPKTPLACSRFSKPSTSMTATSVRAKIRVPASRPSRREL